MYAVIFKARIKQLDQNYADTAERLRERALQEYGCLEFNTFTEGRDEIAISYWPSEAHIAAWKNDSEHLAAQRKGKMQWYEGYTVEVVRVQRRYRHP